MIDPSSRLSSNIEIYLLVPLLFCVWTVLGEDGASDLGADFLIKLSSLIIPFTSTSSSMGRSLESIHERLTNT